MAKAIAVLILLAALAGCTRVYYRDKDVMVSYVTFARRNVGNVELPNGAKANYTSDSSQAMLVMLKAAGETMKTLGEKIDQLVSLYAASQGVPKP